MPKFGNEEAALTYARRVASLRAGDKAKVVNHDDDGLMNAVFTGSYNEDGNPIFLVYSPEHKVLGTAISCWHGVVVD